MSHSSLLLAIASLPPSPTIPHLPSLSLLYSPLSIPLGPPYLLRIAACLAQCHHHPSPATKRLIKEITLALFSRLSQPGIPQSPEVLEVWGMGLGMWKEFGMTDEAVFRMLAIEDGSHVDIEPLITLYLQSNALTPTNYISLLTLLSEFTSIGPLLIIASLIASHPSPPSLLTDRQTRIYNRQPTLPSLIFHILPSMISFFHIAQPKIYFVSTSPVDGKIKLIKAENVHMTSWLYIDRSGMGVVCFDSKKTIQRYDVLQVKGVKVMDLGEKRRLMIAYERVDDSPIEVDGCTMQELEETVKRVVRA